MMKTAAILALGLIALSSPPIRGDEAGDFFETKVRPLLIEHCQKCHGDAKQSGGLRLDSGDALRKGGDNGPVVDPKASRLLTAVRHTDDLKMPPTGKLKDNEIAALETWIKLGAPFPAKLPPKAVAAPHWAFQPVKAPTVQSGRNPIDTFVLAKLEAKGLSLSPPADRATWLRRVTFDLHGLPPTPREIDDFLADASGDAAAKVVDRLLASPRYGERWGRHWLDVARYADSKGYVFTEERRYPYAYTYRDYVVRSFNEDLPYDKFIVEQLAADRLGGDDPRPLAALGFLTLGRRFLNNQNDIIDDRIDVVTRGLLGLTVTCARCHDHKFDPIPTSDYYSLHGVFASCSEPTEGPLLVKPEQTAAYGEFQKQLAKLEAEVSAFRQHRRDELTTVMRVTSQLGGLSFAGLGPSPLQTLPAAKFDRLMNRADRDKFREIQNKVQAFQASSPNAPPRGMVLNDLPKPVEPHIFVRGNAGNRGATVPRQFLGVLAPDRKPFRDGSGRLELARAIADPKNPLTARVLVNRVWAQHFGRGIVTTPSDFGVRSDPPSHPELLDWLADRFVKDGWSIKKLQRMIVLSDAYSQSSVGSSTPADPENRLLARFPRQRLDLEALRDTLLFVSGRLDFALGGPAVDIFKEPFVPRRTLYGFIDRQNLQGLFLTFDFASPDTHAPLRFSTTVPQQALFLMNSPFAVQQTQAVIARPEVAGISAPDQRIEALYRLLFGRLPTSEEVELGMKFLKDEQTGPPRPESKLSPWERYAQVLLLSNEFAFVD